MTGREGVRLAAALLFGAALAFPAGLFLAGRGEADRPPAPRRPAAQVRQVFSPTVRDDPYFLDRQREGVAALEEHCRKAGELCAEARAARAWLTEHAAE